MAIPRIFLALPLSVAQVVELDPAISKYLLQVLRLQPADSLIFFNNTGSEFLAKLKTVSKNSATLVIEQSIPGLPESPLKIHLWQGISRGEKMDFTIQKAVELGVTTITPVFTEYCNVKLQDERLVNRLRHWQLIAINAAQQSGRAYVPKIMPARQLAPWPAGSNGLGLILEPTALVKLSELADLPQELVTLLVGPEGGLSPGELALAKQQGFVASQLGPRVLRTETAALTAISILQAKWGDL